MPSGDNCFCRNDDNYRCHAPLSVIIALNGHEPLCVLTMTDIVRHGLNDSPCGLSCIPMTDSHGNDRGGFFESNTNVNVSVFRVDEEDLFYSLPHDQLFFSVKS